jgi:hypothetical protein
MKLFTSTAPAAIFDKTIASVDGDDTLTIKSKHTDGDVSSVFLSNDDAIALAQAILKQYGVS